MNAGAWVELDASQDNIVSARVGLGAVAPTPLFVEEAGQAVAGKPATEDTIQEAASIARDAARPINDMRGDHRAAQALVRGNGCAGACVAPSEEPKEKWSMATKIPVSAVVNGEEVQFLCDPRQSLLESLRDELGLTGAKEGCNDGNCGACTVMLEDRIVCSCLVLGLEIEGKSVNTIEGLVSAKGVHPIQQAFMEDAALQCGICTPGFIVAAEALLKKNPNPTEHDVRWWLANNLCRCTGYDKIVRAVLNAAANMQEAKA